MWVWLQKGTKRTQTRMDSDGDTALPQSNTCFLFISLKTEETNTQDKL